MRTIKLTLLSLAALCCMPIVHAQNDTIFMTVSGFSCNSPGKGQGDGMKVTSWQMGFSLPTGTGSSGGGAGAGKATFQPLTIIRPFDECSPGLLPNLFTGTHLKTVTLTQYGSTKDGKSEAGTPLMVVTLTTAFITNYTIGGDATNDPAEAWTFKAEKICVKNVSNNAQACWDFATNTK